MRYDKSWRLTSAAPAEVVRRVSFRVRYRFRVDKLCMEGLLTENS